MPRKPSKSARRAARHQLRKSTARTGRQLLDCAWDWLLAELAALKEIDPDKADAACRHLADQIEQIARDTAKEVMRREADVAVR
jgi:RNA polymerase-interacting CarD/CdnL/TRCF family regulator